MFWQKKKREKSYKSLFLFLQLKTAIGAAVASRTKEKVLEELLTYPARYFVTAAEEKEREGALFSIF